MTCAKRKEELKRNQTTLNRIRETGSADSEEQKRIEAEISTLTTELERHREDAKNLMIITSKLKLDAIKSGRKSSLESKQVRTQREDDILQNLKHNFTAVSKVYYTL